MKYFAYILKSESRENYYYGSTEDISKRLGEHNSGKVRYTKGRRLWILHYVEEFDTRSEAVQREKYYKSIDWYNYLKSKNII